jgi:hypothetical protein
VAIPDDGVDLDFLPRNGTGRNFASGTSFASKATLTVKLYYFFVSGRGTNVANLP